MFTKVSMAILSGLIGLANAAVAPSSGIEHPFPVAGVAGM
jgi:hypothetical protein